MRIISQDKKVDIPYELAVLGISDDCHIWSSVGTCRDMIGAYKSLDDARAVLWTIAANFKAGKHYFEMPSEDEDLSYAKM